MLAVDLITAVLEENGEPMRARRIHRGVEAIAGRRLPWSTVIDCLIKNAARDESRVVRCPRRLWATTDRPRRIDADHATGESYTIAHHLFTEDGERKIMIASLRYLDTFAKIDGRWYFAERKLLLDWSETRPSSPGT